jgi:transposase
MGELLMAKQHDQQFKEEAVRYYLDHKELGLRGCAENLGVGYSTLGEWIRDYNTNDGTISTRGSGNYASDIEKENARLRGELRDAKDALDVLKKAISILGK